MLHHRIFTALHCMHEIVLHSYSTTKILYPKVFIIEEVQQEVAFYLNLDAYNSILLPPIAQQPPPLPNDPPPTSSSTPPNTPKTSKMYACTKDAGQERVEQCAKGGYENKLLFHEGKEDGKFHRFYLCTSGR